MNESVAMLNFPVWQLHIGLRIRTCLLTIMPVVSVALVALPPFVAASGYLFSQGRGGRDVS
jgi:hypothetical protein